MTKRIVLHCGLGKTGSSALKVQFSKARDTIIDKLGFANIEKGAFQDQFQGKISSGNSVRLARAFLPTKNPGSLFDRKDEIQTKVLSQIRERAHHILLSSEFFGALPAPQMREFIDVLTQEGDVELVFFVRNQVSLLSSIHMQRVKRYGETSMLEAYFQTLEKQSKQFLYFKIFEKLQEVVPDVPLRIGL